MDEHHRSIIRKNWIYLLENLVLPEILDRLVEEEILTLDMYEEVNVRPTSKDKATHFLFTLLRRGPEAFGKFLKALRETNQEFIADTLCKHLDDNSMEVDKK